MDQFERPKISENGGSPWNMVVSLVRDIAYLKGNLSLGGILQFGQIYILELQRCFLSYILNLLYILTRKEPNKIGKCLELLI